MLPVTTGNSVWTDGRKVGAEREEPHGEKKRNPRKLTVHKRCGGRDYPPSQTSAQETDVPTESFPYCKFSRKPVETGGHLTGLPEY